MVSNFTLGGVSRFLSHRAEPLRQLRSTLGLFLKIDLDGAFILVRFGDLPSPDRHVPFD